MRKLGTILVVGSAVALLVGCEEQSDQLTPIDLEKMRPKVEIPQSRKTLPGVATSEAAPRDNGTADRLPERPPAEPEAPVGEGATYRPTTLPPPETVGPNRPYLEGGDLSPLGSRPESDLPASPGEFTPPGSVGAGL